MASKEATARIKINKLLEVAGWLFFAVGKSPANIQLEPSITIKTQDLDALGEDFEKSSKGFIDFLLLNDKGFPFIVLEAKSEDKSPLVGKEQARKYARSQNCRFVILSNGNLHYFWDLERGNPYVITSFPTPDSVTGYQKITPNPQRLIEEQVGADYIVRTQHPNYASEAAWQNEAERPGYIQANKLRFLRPYQLKAIHSLQAAVGDGKDRFLFEMATGTGKTLTAAAVIKLFLRSGNVRRVLFLVDRLELEDQAKKSFAAVLSADYQTVIYKENRDDWRRAEIVVTTVQSLLFNNKYAFAGDTLSRDQCLLFLQDQITGLHVAGKTALAWQGVRHNLSLREHLMLWGDAKREKLPKWFVDQFPASYRSTTLFLSKASSLGIGTPPGLLECVRVSVPERAVLEMLFEVGKSQDLEEARNLFEGLRGLRFELMGELLSQCTSVKTVRLFLLWARETEVLNISALREKYSLPAGSSSRWMGRLADGTLLSLSND